MFDSVVLRQLAPLLVATLVAGCAGLPVGFEKNPSTALPNPQDTSLGRIVQASLPSDASSGFRLLPTGGFAFDTRIALARRAERTLDVQYYLFHDDEAGRALGREVLAAALRGVRVRVLLDDIATEGKDQMFAQLSAHPNLEVRVFNPFAGGRLRMFTRVLAAAGDFDRINHRMHNKLFVADNAMAITGGRNIGNEYFMQGSASNFIDLDVFAAGAIVPKMSAVFDAFWNSEYAYPASAFAHLKLDDVPLAPEPAGMSAAALTETRDPLGYGPISTELGSGKLALEVASATVVADAPSKVAGLTEETRADTVSSNIVRLMTSAETEVMVISPYFVPGKIGMKAIRAMSARGIRMIVLTNSLAANDSPLVHVGYARYRREMLEQGVQLYELSPTRAQKRGRLGLFGSSHASLHAKVVAVDRKRLFVGSLNLDARSARTNTEMGLLIDSPTMAGQLVELLQADHDESSYRLRLSAKTGGLEWVAIDDGVEVIYTSEPDVGVLFNFGLWLLAPLAPEELL
ncbi:putative cardiolipin synthase [Actimicrobium sp. GrIS 1.19]|uniref:phospholipase D family protein n=1 Tax=Actimicrobium sp. GrIS 1.19 TaxID=3071708 RepID=UPI002E0B09B3|nr:putative cardiolipin synthase [Actimicrobium sp. GrIS 1.19]